MLTIEHTSATNAGRHALRKTHTTEFTKLALMVDSPARLCAPDEELVDVRSSKPQDEAWVRAEEWQHRMHGRKHQYMQAA